MAITQEDIDKAIEFAKEYGATKLLLFGSALYDPENAEDTDLGVEGIEPAKFFLFGAKLEDIILKTVDLVPLEFDTPFISYIKKQGKYIYKTRRLM